MSVPVFYRRRVNLKKQKRNFILSRLKWFNNWLKISKKFLFAKFNFKRFIESKNNWINKLLPSNLNISQFLWLQLLL